MMLLRKNIVLILLLSVCLMGYIVYANVQTPKRIAPPAAYGVNVDMTAMIPNTSYTIRTPKGANFFDLALQLSINTIRITDTKWEITGEEYSQANWRYVFDEAQRHHIRIVLLFMDGGKHTAIDQARLLLDRYQLAHAPALALIDLYNEADVSDEHKLAQLRREAEYAHQIAPGIPVTLGGWKSRLPTRPGQFTWQNPADIFRFIDFVDVVSPHLYEFEMGAKLGFTPLQWTQRFLSSMRQQAEQKPILLEEFGASNGLATTTTSQPEGDLQWQAEVYWSVLHEARAEYGENVIGALAWIFAPRPAFPPGSDDYQGNMSGWAFVLEHGQRLLPAAREFSNVK